MCFLLMLLGSGNTNANSKAVGTSIISEQRTGSKWRKTKESGGKGQSRDEGWQPPVMQTIFTGNLQLGGVACSQVD